MIPITVASKLINKINRFEVYANEKSFSGIFKESGARKWIEFRNKFNSNFIPFYASLNCDQRIDLINYLNEKF